MKTGLYFERHCENFRIIERAITTVQRTPRDHIRKDETKNIYIYTKILSNLINLWAEVRILKIVYEKHAYTNPEKSRILVAGNARDRWVTALKIALSKAYKTPEKNIDDISTPFTERTRYTTLLKWINEDLLNSIQLRNRIAHGQWVYAFTEELTDFQDDLTAKLHQENIVQFQLKYKMFVSLAQIINDLAVSRPAFERDFDMHFRKVEGQKINFHKRNFNECERGIPYQFASKIWSPKCDLARYFQMVFM
jgi:hypothetical protein